MIGQKIKDLRLQKGMTQAVLAKGIVTRNMLSQIENGVAQPSVSTMTELAARLGEPLAYFFAESGDLATFRKIASFGLIKRLYASGDYARCMTKWRELDISDDETEFLAARVCLHLGVEKYRGGYFASSEAYFTEAVAHAQKSLYAEEQIRETAETYHHAIDYIRNGGNTIVLTAERGASVAIGIRADLAYIRALAAGQKEFEFELTCPFYADHLRAHAVLLAGLFPEAETMLTDLAASLDGLTTEKEKERYTVLRFYVLRDLEACSRRLEDFKTAYECSVERQGIASRMGK